MQGACRSEGLWHQGPPGLNREPDLSSAAAGQGCPVGNPIDLTPQMQESQRVCWDGEEKPSFCAVNTGRKYQWTKITGANP